MTTRKDTRPPWHPCDHGLLPLADALSSFISDAAHERLWGLADRVEKLLAELSPSIDYGRWERVRRWLIDYNAAPAAAAEIDSMISALRTRLQAWERTSRVNKDGWLTQLDVELLSRTDPDFADGVFVDDEMREEFRGMGYEACEIADRLRSLAQVVGAKLNKQVDHLQSQPWYHNLAGNRRDAAVYVTQNPGCSQQDIADELHISKRTVPAIIDDLECAGLQRPGKGRSGYRPPK